MVTGLGKRWLRIIYPHWSNMEVGTGNSSRKTLHMERDLESSHLQTGLTCLLPSKIEMTISGYMCKERRCSSREIWSSGVTLFPLQHELLSQGLHMCRSARIVPLFKWTGTTGHVQSTNQHILLHLYWGLRQSLPHNKQWLESQLTRSCWMLYVFSYANPCLIWTINSLNRGYWRDLKLVRKRITSISSKAIFLRNHWILHQLNRRNKT